MTWVTMAWAARVLTAGMLAAQQPGTLDRTVVPPAGPPPVFHPPTWNESTLSNGARLAVLERRGLPLVAMTIHFEGGADQFEPLGKHGVARLTARAMNDGTTTRSGDDLSVSFSRIGAEFWTTMGAEDGAIRLVVLREHLATAVALMADELLHPTFPAAAVARRQSMALVALRQQMLTGSYLDSNAFAHIVYGPRHPYGWVTDSTVIASLTRDDLVAFHAAYFRPARAIITVVGDIDAASARQLLEPALAGWRPRGDPASYAYPSLPPSRPTTIYLMDRPGAAQSSILIGLPGPPRSTPDYDALEVLNKIVGGLFQSRINHIIREEKGWTYRVTSMFAYGHGPGAFTTGGDVVTAKTDSAVLIFLRELRGVQGGRPFTDDEIAEAKAALIQSLPARFGTVDGAGAAIGQLYTDDLPRDYYAQYASRVEAVTATDLLRVANQYLDLAHLAIVVAGDRAIIGASLAALGVGPVVPLDAHYDHVAE